LKEGSTTDICADLKINEDDYDQPVAYAGLVITKTVGTKVYVQTSRTIGNWQYNKAIEFFKFDLENGKACLYTYDIEEEAMIVDDQQI
jgi:hypothetical protein